MSQQMMQQMTFDEVPDGDVFLLEEQHINGGEDWPHKKIGSKAVRSCGRSYSEPSFNAKDANSLPPDTVVIHPFIPPKRPEIPK